MKYLFTCLLISCLSFTSFSQGSLNMDLIGVWEVDSLPAASGIQFNDVWGYVDCNGIEYAILGSAGYVHFISLLDPSSPVEIASFAGGQNVIWRDMKVFEDRAYAVSDGGSEGMMIFDLSNLPYSVTQTYHSSEFFTKAHNIYIEEATGRAYVVGSNASGGDIVILDLNENPDQPVLLANPELPGGGYIHDIFVRDNIAYASHGYAGFYLWDVTDPELPQFISSVVTGGYNHSSWVTDDGQYAIYAEEVPIGLPLGVVDLSEVASGGLSVVNTFKFPLLAPEHVNNRPHNPYIRDNYVICSYYHDGLQIFDISDPLAPQQVAYYDTQPGNTEYSGFEGNWGAYPYLPSGLILASDVTEGLHVLEATAITFDPITAKLYPDGTLIAGQDTTICDENVVEIAVSDEAENYKWYQNGSEIETETGHSILASETGLYFSEVSNGHCMVLSEQVTVGVTDLPNVEGIQGDPISICPESSSLLEVEEGYDEYIWYLNGDAIDGATESSLEVNEAGTYSVAAMSEGCSAVSVDVEVSVFEAPVAVLDQSGTLTLCEGETILLAFTELTDDVFVDWSLNGNSVLGNEDGVSLSEAGIYSAVITSSAGCVIQTEEVFVEISTIQIPLLNENGGILMLTTPAESNQWYLNNQVIEGATEPNYEYTEAGIYTVVTTNENGCTATSVGFEAIPVGVEERYVLNNFSLFPNPAHDLVQVAFTFESETKGEMKIIDFAGRDITRISFSGKSVQRSIDISDFVAGVYLVSIQTERGVVSKKLIVQ